MSEHEDLSFLNVPTFKTFKVKSGRTYVQLDEKGNSIAISFQSWKDSKSGDVVTGVVIRPVVRAVEGNAVEIKEAVEAGAIPDHMNKVVRKQKTFQPTHWGFASPQDVLNALEQREFFPRLMAQIKEVYGVDIKADQFKNTILVSDPAFANAIVKDFREVIDIAL